MASANRKEKVIIKDGSNIINSGILGLQHLSFCPNDLQEKNNHYQKTTFHSEFVPDSAQVTEEREGKRGGRGQHYRWRIGGNSSEVPLFFPGDEAEGSSIDAPPIISLCMLPC